MPELLAAPEKLNYFAHGLPVTCADLLRKYSFELLREKTLGTRLWMTVICTSLYQFAA